MQTDRHQASAFRRTALFGFLHSARLYIIFIMAPLLAVAEYRRCLRLAVTLVFVRRVHHAGSAGVGSDQRSA